MKDWVDLGVGYIPRWFTCPQTVTKLLRSDPTGSWTHSLLILSSMYQLLHQQTTYFATTTTVTTAAITRNTTTVR